MKKIVEILIFCFVIFSLQLVHSYQLTINATSDVADITTSYNYRIWDLNTYTLSMGGGFVTSPDTLNLEEGNYVLYGKSYVPNTYYQYAGHFFYGEHDELTIISLNEENPSQTIDIHIIAGGSPHYFKTYDVMEINGHDVIPIYQEFVLSVFTRQLVYENDNNDIMLVGHQLYTPNGWETSLYDEEFLYIDNDAEVGDTFYSHNYLMWQGGDYFSRSTMQVLGSNEFELDGNLYNTKAVYMYFNSMMDTGYKYWYEFTGGPGPLVRSLRESGSRSTIYKENHDGGYDSSKLIDLAPNTEILYNYEVEQGDSPRNLSYIDGIFYWFPPSQRFLQLNQYTPRQVFYWQHEFDNEVLLDSVIFSPDYDAYIFDQADILHTNYSFWLRSFLPPDSTYSQPSNVLTWPVTANEDEDIMGISKLHNNYPNPFNPETTISFSLDKAEQVTLEIFNIKGQKIKTLLSDYLIPGRYNHNWNGKDEKGINVSSGLYLYRLKCGKKTTTKKMTLLK